MPTGLIGVAGAVYGLQSYFQANVADQVALLNTQTSDPLYVAIDVPAIYRAEQPQPGTAYPWIEILPVRTTKMPETALLFAPTHILAAQIWFADEEGRESIRDQGYRYVRLIEELVKLGRDNPTFAGAPNVSIGDVDYGPLRWRRGESRVVGNVIIALTHTAAEVLQ